jgi:hypothetical protein
MSLKSQQELGKYVQRLNAPGNWVYIVPLSGIELTEAVNHEFQICRTLLVSRDKLLRIRRRLGIPYRLSELKKDDRELLDSGNTFAIVRHSGNYMEVDKYCRYLVQEELFILAVSQLCFTKRRLGPCPTIKGQGQDQQVENLLLETGVDKDKERVHWRGQNIGKMDELRLDKLWVNFQRDMVFYRLLKGINGGLGLQREFSNELKRAAILLGQSHCSSDIAHAFLWNVISLELLLTRRNGDKAMTALPERAEALLGWLSLWNYQNFKERIKNIYAKRNDFLHKGDWSNIEIEDLLFTDDLLFNLLLNILHHPKIFHSKTALIEFSQKVEAEHILGVKPKVRPKTFQYLLSNYSGDDFEEI